jgi:hypothetical protein
LSLSICGVLSLSRSLELSLSLSLELSLSLYLSLSRSFTAFIAAFHRFLLPTLLLPP